MKYNITAHPPDRVPLPVMQTLAMKNMHIIGMAKSHMDLRGAKGPKIELDFLKIAYALARINAKGEAGKGYLLVLTKAISQRANTWKNKYGTGDSIEIIIGNLTDRELDALRKEKRKNREGMILGAQGNEVEGKSNADTGQKIGETKLIEEIQKRHPSVNRIDDPKKSPLGTNWDFYGKT